MFQYILPYPDSTKKSLIMTYTCKQMVVEQQQLDNKVSKSTCYWPNNW